MAESTNEASALERRDAEAIADGAAGSGSPGKRQLQGLEYLSDDQEVLGFDPVAFKQKCDLERDRRLRPDGIAQYARASSGSEEVIHDPYAERIERDPIDADLGVLLIGGGFSSLITGAYLRKAGFDDIWVCDRAGDFGGVWYWNRYPNAQCDTESYMYLPLLEDTGYVPTRNYAYRDEIFGYSKKLAETFDLYRNALFHTEVRSAKWDADAARWIVTTDRGDCLRARYIVNSNGSLALPKLPRIPGIDTFKGRMFHTSLWDYDYTGPQDADGKFPALADKRVGIVGTGSTAIQVVPAMAGVAKDLYVIQRTPSAVGIRGNRLTDPEWFASMGEGWQRDRMENFTAATEGEDVGEVFVSDGWIDLLTSNQKAIRSIKKTGYKINTEEYRKAVRTADYLKVLENHARVDSIVEDKETAEALKPWYRPLCKRPCFHDEYLPAFNHPNVHLLDASNGGIEAITENGVVVGGKEHPLDCLIFATGFETGMNFAQRAGYDIVGADGHKLSDKWNDGYRTMFGISTEGFPNCFFTGFTQTPLPQNIPYLLELQAEHISYMLEQCAAEGKQIVHTNSEGEKLWMDEFNSKSRDMDHFYAECTPGYYNSEGNLANVHGQFKGLYQGGTRRYTEMMRKWRASGDHYGVDYL